MALNSIIVGAKNLTPAQKDKFTKNVTPAKVVIATSTPPDLAKKLLSSSSARQSLINAADKAKTQIVVNKETAEIAKQIIKEDEDRTTTSQSTSTTTAAVKEKITEVASTVKDKVQTGAIKIEDFITTHLLPVLIAVFAIVGIAVFLLFTKQGQKIAAQLKP